MPIRTVVLFNLGPPFGGFRFAVRPGSFGLDDPEGFAALEKSIGLAYTLLAAHPPDTWAEAAQRGFDLAIPRLGDREGVIDATGSASNDQDGDLVLRACFPFQFWPLGGWVVHEGWHRSSDGTWRPFTDEELSSLW